MEPSAYKRAPRKKAKKRKKGSKPRYMYTSTTSYGVLKQSADRIFFKAEKSAEIYPDNRVYFKIVFSDSMSWPKIQEAIQELRATIVRIIDDKTAKFAIEKKDYPQFILALHNRKHVIGSVTETTLSEKIAPNLAQAIEEKPEQTVDVTFQVVDMGGFKDSKELEDYLRRYLKDRDLGVIEPIYKTSTRAVYDVRTKGRIVNELADALSRVESVEPMPEITLESEVGSSPEGIFWGRA